MHFSSGINRPPYEAKVVVEGLSKLDETGMPYIMNFLRYLDNLIEAAKKGAFDNYRSRVNSL